MKKTSVILFFIIIFTITQGISAQEPEQENIENLEPSQRQENIQNQEQPQKQEGIQNLEQPPTYFTQFYDTEMFQWNRNFFGGLTLNYQNQNKRIFWGVNSTMENALLRYPDSGEAYNTYKRLNTTGSYMIIGGAGVMTFGYFYPFLKSGYYYYDYDLYLRNMEIAAGIIGTGLIIEIIGLLMKSAGRENLFHAVNMYNRNIALELNR